MDYGTLGQPPNSKRRRSSLAQLGELLQSWGSKDREKYCREEEGRSQRTHQGGSRRGTLADIGKNLPWMRRESQAEVINKIRKRRDTAADITIIRKSSIVDIKNDISRILTIRQSSVQKGDDLPSPPAARSLYEDRRARHQDSQKHLLYRTKMESTSVPFPASPPSPDVATTTLLGSSPTTTTLCQATSPTALFLGGESRSLHSSNSKDSAEQVDSKGTGSEDSSREPCDAMSPQLSPTSRRPIQRQSTAYDERMNQPTGLTGGRRGSRPFLSPGEASSPMGGSLQGRGGRRDSLSPDSAAEDAGGSRKGRRDSRQDGSSERDSRESSPRSMVKRWGRRWSSGAKEDKTCRSPDSGSSREASPKFGEGHPAIGLRRQSTTDEILIARGFRRESTTEDLMRCRNFRRQSSTVDLDMSRAGRRRDSSTQINDGQVNSMTVEMSQVGLLDASSLTNHESSMYENSNYHEECLKCNSCGLNLTGPNQRRARRFKNQILCDLHFADMALMESSDFMQQLRNFKAQSLGCAVARRKSSTTLIFPLPPQVAPMPLMHFLGVL